MATETANLTERQQQVYDRVTQGMKPSEIAGDLGLSPNAVQGHMKVLRSRKLIPKAGSSRRSRPARASSSSRRQNGATAVTRSEERAGSDAGHAVLAVDGVPSLEKAVHEIDDRLSAIDAERARLLAIKSAATGVTVPA